MMPRRTYRVEKGELVPEDAEEWRLRVDLVRPEDYYPDPSGNGLYEVHHVERDFHTILAAAEGDDAIYDKAAVMSLLGTDQEKPLDEQRTAEDMNQNEPLPRGSRKRVLLDEFWGTILDQDGKIMERDGVKMQNVVCTVANGHTLIRKPEPNPFWHQESPFIAIPLLRVPFSVWHRALYDDAVDLNLALNEMFNLILDGGIAAVWGVRQIRLEDLEDPEQVADGVPQGITLAVKQTLPPNAKVMETLTEGDVPQDAMAVFEFLNREYLNSVLNNEVTVGALPPKQIRATEVVEASQSRAITIDGLVSDMEHGLARLLRLSWYTIMQNMDRIPDEALQDVVDRQVAYFLSNATAEERFALFFGKSKFKAFGLSATLAKAMHFQKLIALQQAVRADPILMRAYLMEFSGPKMLRTIMRALNINTDDVKKDKDELAQVQQEVQDVAMLSGLAGQPGGQSAAGAAGQGGEPLGGGGDTAAQMNQMSNTRTGLTPNA
jgi:hypothetical protein